MLKIIQLDSMETEENKNGKCADCANMQTIRELECVKETESKRCEACAVFFELQNYKRLIEIYPIIDGGRFYNMIDKGDKVIIELIKQTKIDVIYTFIKKKKTTQDNKVFVFSEELFKTKKTFVDFLIKDLDIDKLNELDRISTQVFYCHSWIKLPYWYNDCNGKFFFENGKFKN